QVKRGTIDWLVAKAGRGDHAGAYEEWRSHVAAGDMDDFRALQPHDGKDVHRSDMPEGDESIRYKDFSPPALWGGRAPYSVLRVRVQKKGHPFFMYHGGEEILFPASPGEIIYTFAHPTGGAL